MKTHTLDSRPCGLYVGPQTVHQVESLAGGFLSVTEYGQLSEMSQQRGQGFEQTFQRLLALDYRKVGLKDAYMKSREMG